MAFVDVAEAFRYDVPKQTFVTAAFWASHRHEADIWRCHNLRFKAPYALSLRWTRRASLG